MIQHVFIRYLLYTRHYVLLTGDNEVSQRRLDFFPHGAYHLVDETNIQMIIFINECTITNCQKCYEGGENSALMACNRET